MSEQTANTMDYELGGEGIQEEATTERCLSFQVDDLILFLSTDYVVEIVNDYPITPLPMVPSFIISIRSFRFWICVCAWINRRLIIMVRPAFCG